MKEMVRVGVRMVERELQKENDEEKRYLLEGIKKGRLKR